MKQGEAILLIRDAKISELHSQTWADLGCGSGVFTAALASLLPGKSRIHAVDRSPQQLPAQVGKVDIIFRRADFENDELDFFNLHGILMANSLHYVDDAFHLIGRLNSHLDPVEGQYLLIEYDSPDANRWVPYPLPFSDLKKLFIRHGFTRIEKLAEKKSLYRQGNMYACQVRR